MAFKRENFNNFAHYKLYNSIGKKCTHVNNVQNCKKLYFFPEKLCNSWTY